MNKDVLVIFLGFLAALIAGAILMASLEKNGSALRQGEVPVSVIAQGSDSGTFMARKNYRIKSVEELSMLWGAVHGTDGPNLPSIDFDTEEVLAVFDGTRQTGGYSVEVASVFDVGGTRTVTIHHFIPGESCMASQAMTSPFTLVRLKKTNAPLSRADVDVVRECE